MLRHGVRQLERCRHPRLLHVLHSVEETSDTLAFATEPVATSLGNALAALEDSIPADGQQQQQTTSGNTIGVADNVNGGRRNSAREIKPPASDIPFLDIEIKYGIYQVYIYRAAAALCSILYNIIKHMLLYYYIFKWILLFV